MDATSPSRIVQWEVEAAGEVCLGPSGELPVSKFANKFDPIGCKKSGCPKCLSQVPKGTIGFEMTGKAGVVVGGQASYQFPLVPFEPFAGELNVQFSASK